MRLIDRQIEIYGRPPRQVAFDGGYTSQANLRDIKAKGVNDVVFHKKRGLEISDMAKSAWVFKRLKNFRAGIEGCISALKRAFDSGKVSLINVMTHPDIISPGSYALATIAASGY